MVLERSERWISIGAGLMALAVLAGALGAHSLAPYFVAERGAEWWEKAARYHALHALGTIGYGLYLRGRSHGSWPGCCFAVGTLLFSGSLYAMALGAPRWFGMITPFLSATLALTNATLSQPGASAFLSVVKRIFAGLPAVRSSVVATILPLSLPVAFSAPGS